MTFCGCEGETIKKIVRVFNLFGGLTCIALGILRFILTISNTVPVIDHALSIYFIIFGIGIGLAEFDVEFIVIHTFSFLRNYFGRAIFFIL